jgi:hypothetical protein
MPAHLGLIGVAALTAGVWLAFGMPFGLIVGGFLLILDALMT